MLRVLLLLFVDDGAAEVEEEPVASWKTDRSDLKSDMIKEELIIREADRSYLESINIAHC